MFRSQAAFRILRAGGHRHCWEEAFPGMSAHRVFVRSDQIASDGEACGGRELPIRGADTGDSENGLGDDGHSRTA
ncbi:hypothetical protein [Desulfonema magnum]|uniref:hypothetical protein n=1 Tax=Desulfonema magnum TaxID=45655 RepID=UPI001A9AD349|nr:hypothetical protein [Desulfonema magnum]